MGSGERVRIKQKPSIFLCYVIILCFVYPTPGGATKTGSVTKKLGMHFKTAGLLDPNVALHYIDNKFNEGPGKGFRDILYANR